MVTISAGQLRAARGLLGWSQSDLAEAAKIGRATIADFESGKRDPYVRTIDELRAALEAAGVEFTNGDQPGVRMKKTKSEKLLNERERAAAAKTLAREWTAYCKEHNSMAFASAIGDLIRIKFRRVGGMEVFNSFTVRVLDRGFEVDGKTVEKDTMERVVFAELEKHPYRV
jgi:transcriptional regulator with XRE-family HTH domain